MSWWPLFFGGALSLLFWVLLWRLYPLSALAEWGQFEIRKTPGHFNSPKVRLTALLFVLMWASYAGVCHALWRNYRDKIEFSRALPWVGGLLLVAVAALSARMYPFASIDSFYYMCELKLHYFYGANPYLVPFEPRYSADPFARYSGFTHATCVYGPAWFWLSWPAIAVTGFNDLGVTLGGYKIWSALWVVVCGLLILWGTRPQRPWLSAALWLCSPFVWFDGVGNSHNDIMMAAVLIGAVLLARAPQAKFAWLALPLLAVAILIKPSAAPLAWVFLIWMRRVGWTPRALWISGALGVLVALVILAPFAQSGAFAGWRAGVQVSIEPFTSSPLSLAREILFNKKAPASLQHLVRPLGLGLLLILALASPWLVRRFEHNLAIVLGLTYLLAGSMFPWYLLPIVALLCLQLDSRTLVYIVLASLFGLIYSPLETWGYFNSPLAGHGVQVNLLLALILAFPLMLWIGSALGRPIVAASKL